jgi:DNA-binding transcriptional LysR family regulator
LVLLSEERQLGRAAARLGISQPAASKTLADIEERIGNTLFVRGPHETLPTQSGQILVNYARHCLGETKRVVEELEALELRKAKVLRIGMLGSSATTVVPNVVEELTRSDHLIEITLEESDVPKLVEKLRACEIDLFVGRIDTGVPRDEFEEIFLYDEPIVIVCRRTHPLLQLEDIRLIDTLRFQWIVPHRTTFMRQKIDDMFRISSLSGPKRLIESNSIVANLSLLQCSDRLCAMTQSVARRWVADGLLAEIALDVGVNPGSIGVVLRRNESHLGAIGAFITSLRSLYPER